MIRHSLTHNTGAGLIMSDAGQAPATTGRMPGSPAQRRADPGSAAVSGRE
jgi:hypothetical protein